MTLLFEAQVVPLRTDADGVILLIVATCSSADEWLGCIEYLPL
jgi:hypothetical protein